LKHDENGADDAERDHLDAKDDDHPGPVLPPSGGARESEEDRDRRQLSDRVNFVSREDVITFNFDFHYDFPVSGNYYLWAGAGPAILYNNPDGPRESDTDFAADFLLGIGFGRDSNVVPYIQGKLIAADDSDFSIAFGVRF
jgi:hypothetical protein